MSRWDWDWTAARRWGLHGRAFVSAHTGPLVFFRLGAAVTSAMDGRDYLYGDAGMGDFGQAITYPAALATYMNRYRPDFILMRHVNLSLEHHPWLQQQGGMYVYFDDRYFLMVSSRVEYKALIQQEGYQYITGQKVHRR